MKSDYWINIDAAGDGEGAGFCQVNFIPSMHCPFFANLIIFVQYLHDLSHSLYT